MAFSLRVSGAVTCAADMFRCQGSHACVPRHWLCDGDRDCPNGSDELSTAGCGERLGLGDGRVAPSGSQGGSELARGMLRHGSADPPAGACHTCTGHCPPELAAERRFVLSLLR